MPILDSILPSNDEQIERGIRAVMRQGLEEGRHARLLSFKAGTDDLRESPMVELVERLIGKGYDLRVYDQQRAASRAIHGANQRLHPQPHPAHLEADGATRIDEVLAHAETIVIGNAQRPSSREVPRMLGEGQSIIDLVRIARYAQRRRQSTTGICW